MDLQRSLLSPILAHEGSSSNLTIDLQGLVHKMLLFDNFILDSRRLTEIFELVRALGLDQTCELLNGPGFWIKCDVLTMTNVGQVRAQLGLHGKSYNLPLGAFDLSYVTIQQNKLWSDSIASLRTQLSGMPQSQFRHLERAVESALRRRPDTIAPEAAQQLRNDILENQRFLQRVIAHRATAENLGLIRAEDIGLEAIEDGEDILMESNLLQLLGLDEQRIHLFLERCLLGVGAFYQRLDEMKGYCSLTGYSDDEAWIMQQKFSFLGEQFNVDNAQAQEKRLSRVLKIGNLPIVDPERLNVGRLIQLRRSDECVELRSWLRGTDGMSDKDIGDRFNSLHARMGNMAASFGGCAVRVLSQGLATLPIHNPVIGLAATLGLGLLDKFTFEHILPRNGVVAFLSDSYPKLFRS